MATMALSDYYKILGISISSNQDEIKRAFRRLAKETHPDVAKTKDASTRFVEINEAYAILGDPEKRKSYHLQLQRAQRESINRSTSTTASQANTREGRQANQSGREYDEWVRQARERADQDAGMSWAEYRSTRFDDTEIRMFYFLQVFMFGFVFFLSLFVMLFPVLLMFNFYWMLVFLCLFSVPLGMKIMQESIKGIRVLRSTQFTND